MAKSILPVFCFFLLFIPLAEGQAKPLRTYYRVGTCDTAEMARLFDAQAPQQEFVVYAVCSDFEWKRLLQRVGTNHADLGIIDATYTKIFIGPEALGDPFKLQRTVSHELEHLRCRCKLGEHF